MVICVRLSDSNLKLIMFRVIEKDNPGDDRINFRGLVADYRDDIPKRNMPYVSKDI